MHDALTVMGMLAEQAHHRPDTVALSEPAAEPPTSMSYGSLAKSARNLADELAEAGIQRGDVVGVWLPNWAETVVAEFALASLGAAVLGINTRYNVHEIAHLLSTATPRHVIVPFAFHGLDFTGRLHAAVAESGHIPQVLVVRTLAGADTRIFDVGAGAHAAGENAHAGLPARYLRGAADDLANLFTTSGSSGVPKLAGHDQQAVVRHSRNVAHALEFGPGDVLFAVLPFAGVYGFNSIMAALAAGATCVLESVFDPTRALQLIDTYRVTHLIGGDDLFGRLKDTWTPGTASLASWRRGAIADFGGRSPEIAVWTEKYFGVRVSGVYGSSEGFALAAIHDPARPLDERIRGGGLQVSADIEVRVIHPATGRELASGQTGELQFRGYHVMTGYLGNPTATTEAFTGDGWLRSGDLGYTDPDGAGYVYSCRAGDALRLRGFLVQPAEIETFLLDHEDVAAAKVVGTHDRNGADVAIAFIVSTDEATTDIEPRLLDHCRDNLAPFKVPTRVVRVAELPTTTGTNGPKVRTTVLRQWADELNQQA
jgi:fatty-acyl-CoA synthase